MVLRGNKTMDSNMLEQHLLTGHKFTKSVRVKADSH